MTDPVPADQIEAKVGTVRHRHHHIARAESTDQTVYILHSHQCVNTYVDLTRCRYSVALDQGGITEDWPEDVPVVVAIYHDLNERGRPTTRLIALT